MPSGSAGRSGISTTRLSEVTLPGPELTGAPEELTTSRSWLRSRSTGSLKLIVTRSGAESSVAPAGGLLAVM